MDQHKRTRKVIHKRRKQLTGSLVERKSGRISETANRTISGNKTDRQAKKMTCQYASEDVTSKKKKYPRVPIKTYKWEDIKRSRRKGGYPWTHLYKQPFNEQVDPEPFIMSALKESKNTSTVEQAEGVQICDVTENEGAEEKMDSLQIVTEPDDPSARNSIGSIIIEECDLSYIGEADMQKPENTTLESADSSDNISQYLDKDDRGPNKELESKDGSTNENEYDTEKSENQNLANEEDTKRKRKLSSESSYSKISSTKEAFLKKLKDTKNKIKGPKLKCTVNKVKKSTPKKSKNVSFEPKKELKKHAPSHKEIKPVYIHIPLKPPPGQSDEFSYLEFEEDPLPKPPQIKATGSFKFVAKNIKRLQESLPNEQYILEEDIKAKEDSEMSRNLEETVEINDENREKTKTKNTEENSGEMEFPTNEQSILEEDTKAKEDSKVSRNLEEAVEINDENREKTKTKNTEENIGEMEIPTDDLESNSASRRENDDEKCTLKPSIDDSSSQPQKEMIKETPKRAKSEEPERKRKLSLESSYSRKSLSRLEIMKRLKDTSQKIKKTFSLTRKKKQQEIGKNETEKEKPIEKTTKPSKKEQQAKPVYIYIPLKPQEGETLQEDESSQQSNTPESPVVTDVQFIILTAPSDDEILDYHSSDVPETPSENQTFFDNKIEDLKKIAKDAAKDINSSTDKLEPVTEEISNGEKIEIEVNNVNPPTTVSTLEKTENMSNDDKKGDEMHGVQQLNLNKSDKINDKKSIMVDVEDGLSESCIPEDKQNSSIDDHIASNISMESKPEQQNIQLENVPVIKKKVSFKRRSKTSKDGSYEDIGQPVSSNVSDGKEERNDLKQDFDVDLSFCTTDKNQLQQSATPSPIDDDDKWSKISDHEYEPVNPPHEIQTILHSTPAINVAEELGNIQSVNIHHEVITIRGELALNDGVSGASDPPFLNDKEIMNTSLQKQPTDVTKQDVHISEKNKDPNKLQLVWRQTADQFKNKLRNIKKHQTPKHNKPKSRKSKFERPKFNLPKIPDTSKINLPSLPSFNFPRRNSTKRSQNERQESTESNVGDSKKITFDFSTYPRIFKNKSKSKSEVKQEEFLDLATNPQLSQEVKNRSGGEIIRVPLHSEESVSDENMDMVRVSDKENEQKNENLEYSDDEHMTSHIRYKDDIDIDDEFESQEINNDDYLNRWRHGNFNPDLEKDFTKQFENSRYEVSDLDIREALEHQAYDFNSNQNRERYSSGSSLGAQRLGGVLEEINPDEFFLRQKGISQDNIEVGMYLSSEIKEAFRTPENALSKIEDRDYSIHHSNQSLPETQNKRKPIKKPKRKKTPHVSHERISHGESEDDDTDFIPPLRPKRRSKRKSKSKNFDDIIPYQETIPLETNVPVGVPAEQDIANILNRFEKGAETHATYDNEELDNHDLSLAHPDDLNFEYIDDNHTEKPAAPPRKHKSLKSLNSENESLLADISSQIQTSSIDVESNQRDSEFITPATYPLKRPSRKKSRTSLQSQTSSQSKDLAQKEDENFSSSSQIFTSENQIPCVEEPCFKDIRDYMGYAIIDKQKVRDPPLPPPRSFGRKKRSTQQTESNFFTVPRQSRYDDTPVRPLRNYSTLSQTKKVLEPVTYENKENFDITQYIEIEDEPNRDLQSGDVIRKMKDRPLPAPPRPPRKSRVLQNITSKENIMSEMQTPIEILDHNLSHSEEISDNKQQDLRNENYTESDINEKCILEQRLITPEYFTHQEIITHGSLLVQSLDGHKILKDSELTSRSEERIIPVLTEFDDETSSVPEDFKKLKNPSEVIKTQETSHINTQTEVLKAQKLQVMDLDVDTLTVNKLLAGKIIVSEIDSHSIHVDEINSRTVQDNESNMSDQGQEFQEEKTKHINIEHEMKFETTDEEKKTSININEKELFEKPATHVETITDQKDDIIKEIQLDDPYNQQNNESLQNYFPKPPPRSSDINMEKQLPLGSSGEYPQQFPETVSAVSNDEVIQELDVDDEPPPRPPQPYLDYIPSQPPASFYALRAQKYVDSVDSNIPKSRRKRPVRSLSKSSSEDSLVTPITRRLHNRTSEPSITQLSGQLLRTCGSTAHCALKRLITDITENIKKNADGKLDLHVMTIILLILIAGLLLLGYGDEKTIVHLHHWEYFNPPKDL